LVDVRGALAKLIPPEKAHLMHRSYDIIGDIAVVKVPSELDGYEKEVGEAVHEIHPYLRAVFRETGEEREEVERTRQLRLIWSEPSQSIETGSTGDKGSVGRTVHTEYGCRFAVDVEKVFFSPRLSFERMRVAKQVKPGEVVVNMFGGVGIYAIIIAKVCPQVEKIYTVDVNPVAYELAKENVAMNKFSGKVIPILGDSREYCMRELRGVCDRAIMVLPKSGTSFLDAAVVALKERGECILNFYVEIAGDVLENEVNSVIDKVESKLSGYGVERCEVDTWRIASKVGPRRYHAAIDFRVTKKTYSNLVFTH